ncbi:hypothetical protein BKA65DRAFT_493215 [Rhexocercosporidium sp. MPI-PUGE-AT-0058]|nr:hypothetical protein BKA65DRAFT_493215 [Rhexocercosporidium sp. MPI-PUGE-AT-0058]
MKWGHWPNGKALDFESRDCRFDPCVAHSSCIFILFAAGHTSSTFKGVSCLMSAFLSTLKINISLDVLELASWEGYQHFFRVPWKFSKLHVSNEHKDIIFDSTVLSGDLSDASVKELVSM